jgi:hypothetical protein
MNTLELRNTVKAILQYLPPWSLDKAPHVHFVRANHPEIECAGIIFNLRGERLEIYGSYPRNHYPLREKRPFITVDPGRAPDSIARGIQRRFLSDYLPLIEEVAAAKRRYDCALAVVNNHLDALGKILGATPSPLTMQQQGRIYADNCTIKAHVTTSPDAFRLNISSIDFATLRSICYLLTED